MYVLLAKLTQCILSHMKMGKEILRWMIFKVALVWASKKISSSEKNYKYFIGYLYSNHKVKELYIMLSIFWLKMMTC